MTGVSNEDERIQVWFTSCSTTGNDSSFNDHFFYCMLVKEFINAVADLFFLVN